ncbi:SafA/ExsA family spore coat assembly protein [uncultured Oscillibacter sp.]|uniref:SafA/ExsA family spore coat assembly protein n=1 Tax=uncultured Oscillibacter sp. TaxID=876091 RepID=UPI00280AEB76|nr:SafA/ExsA family spore coat assembly protein [uncultured Oscillibacter sp.]
MRLAPMRYKEFTWPHNPETYQVEHRRQVAVHKVPFGGYVLQDLGAGCRVLEGEGTFAGKDAYATFRALEQVFDQPGPGLLVHPVWPASSAYFVTLQLTEEPLPDFVRYRFAFWEDQGGYKAGLTEIAAGGTEEGGSAGGASQPAPSYSGTYVVRKGDTLWGIAGRYGVALADLIAANPQIKNPNLIYPGETVVIP